MAILEFDSPAREPSFARLLRDHRLRAGLTQAALAGRAGLSVRAIQHLEAGLGQPYPETARRLSDALALTCDALLLFEIAARPTPRRRAISRRVFDVFLWHHRGDGLLVDTFAEALRTAGVEPWFERWQAPAGDDPDEAAVRGVAASRTCAVCIGPRGLGDWESGALGHALRRAHKDPSFRVFPVLLPGLPEPFDATTLPPPLATQPWVDLRAGRDQPRAVQALIAAVRGSLPGPAWPVGLREVRCPYRGLQPFEREHAELYFGREADVQRLLEQLKISRFVSVVAPSGAGKSSLVRAGLLPALSRGALPGSQDWLPCLVIPGAQPLTSLAASLSQLTGAASTQRTLDRLAKDPRGLHLTTSLALARQAPSARALVVVDQFEEIFTQCHTESERDQFIANLLYAATVSEGRTLVVLLMRADFYLRCASHPELAARIAAHQHLLSPLDDRGLRYAIEGPARRVGLVLEPGLVDTILDEVANEPGALPLLEHALLELWARRRGDLLTLEGYRASGGVHGAIAQCAEAAYSSLSADNQMVARRVLLRLSEPGEGTEDTRRRATLGELITGEGERAAIEQVVRTLTDARLLTTSGDLQGGECWVEVAHEALIRHWPRLRQWLDEDRAALRIHRRLTDAAREWQRLRQDDGALYRGTRLSEALEWRDQHAAALNDAERGFLAASQALPLRERAARERQRRLLTAGLSGGLVAALLLCTLAGVQWWRAESERQVAVARELAFQAEAVRKGSAALLPRSVLLAAETLRRFPSRETEPTLRLGLALLSRPLASLAHQGHVQALAYSPDGQYLATADDDGDAHIWTANGEHEMARLPHGGPVRALAWRPDGLSLATASDDGSARVWDTTSGREVLYLAHDNAVYALAYSPDGQRLATASVDGSARVWDSNGEILARMSHAGPVPARYSPDGGNQVAVSTTQSIGFSPDGRTIVTARSLDNTARVWDASSGREIARLSHRALVLAATFSPDGQFVATGSADGTARIWNAVTGQEVEGARLTIERNSPIFTVAFSPDGRYLAAGGHGSITRVEEIASGAEVTSLWHDDAVQALAWSHDGRHLATASDDRTARVWEIPGGREVTRMPIETAGRVYSVAFSPDDAYLATASDDRTVRVWAATKPWTTTGLSHPDNVILVKFSPDGRYLATTSGDAAFIWDATSGKELRRLEHPSLAWAIDFSSDGRSLLASGFDGVARLWDTASGQQIQEFQHGKDVRVYGAALSADGRYAATTGQEGDVRVWEVATGRQVMFAAHDAAAGYPHFTPDGRYLITGSVDRTIRVWDLATAQEVRRMVHDYPINDLQISPNGRYVAAGDDQTARVWELATGRSVLVLPHDSAVNGVAFSPDGQYLATAARNGVARVWELVSGRQVAGMAHDAPLNGLAFSPDGHHLATASNDGTVRLWVPVLDDPVAEACARVTRNLTQAEWHQYLRDEAYRKTCPELP